MFEGKNVMEFCIGTEICKGFEMSFETNLPLFKRHRHSCSTILLHHNASCRFENMALDAIEVTTK